MRLYYPLNDKPLFVYPAISIRKYDWSVRPKVEKIRLQVFGWGWLLGFGYFGLVAGAHRWITWSDFSWAFVFKTIECVAVVALFPLIILPVLNLALGGKHRFENKFYTEWAHVFSDMGKRRYSSFFIEHIDYATIKRAYFIGRPFYLVTVKFKLRRFLDFGKPQFYRFGLDVSNEDALKPFQQWLKSRRVKLEWEVPADNQPL